MVADLIKGFVPGKWVLQLDFASLERVHSSYVSDKYKWREGDIVWRLRFAKKTWLYVYILTEFQSRPDQWMALRMVVYCGLLYQDLIKQNLLTPDNKLPPLIPIVMYNGEEKWDAPTDIWELIEPVPGMQAYRPKWKYLLLEEHAYDEKELSKQENLVAALFRLEKSRTPEDIRRVLNLLIEWIADPSQVSLRRAFHKWLCDVLAERLGRDKLPETKDLIEVRTMLANRITEWTEQWKAEGKAEGRAEGKAEALLAVITTRDLPITQRDKEKILVCNDAKKLEQWITRAVTANSIAEVFAEA